MVWVLVMLLIVCLFTGWLGCLCLLCWGCGGWFVFCFGVVSYLIVLFSLYDFYLNGLGWFGWLISWIVCFWLFYLVGLIVLVPICCLLFVILNVWLGSFWGWCVFCVCVLIDSVFVVWGVSWFKGFCINDMLLRVWLGVFGVGIRQFLVHSGVFVSGDGCVYCCVEFVAGCLFIVFEVVDYRLVLGWLVGLACLGFWCFVLFRVLRSCCCLRVLCRMSCARFRWMWIVDLMFVVFGDLFCVVFG